MFIPEPFSLTTGIMGVIGFLATVHNGVETLYKDAKKWQRYGREIIIINEKTKWEKDELVKWVDLWMAWKKEDNLLDEFWGRTGCKEIQDLAKNISELCSEIERPMNIYLKATPEKKLLRFRSKTKWVVAGAADMERQVKALEDMVVGIKRKALDLFITERGLPAPPSVKYIHDIGNMRHLTSLAMATSQVSEDLKAACVNSWPSHTVDLELNLFNVALEHNEETTVRKTGPSEGLGLRSARHIRSKAISDSAADGRLNFVVLTKRKPLSGIPNDQVLRTSVSNLLAAMIQPDMEFRDSLLSACQDIRSNSQQNSGWHVYGSNHFVIEKAFNDYPDGYDDWPSLRQALCNSIRQPIPPIESPIPRKIKLAFELVECTLMFLRTSWLSNLCSCSLRERRPAHKCHYVLRGGEDKHFLLAEPGKPQIRCWSERRAPKAIHEVGLRRLGILLSEIALESPIVTIAAADGGGGDFTYVKMVGQPPAESLPLPLARLPADVFVAVGSNGYKVAVAYCLNSKQPWDSLTAQTEDKQRAMLREYYWKVLEPLQVDLEQTILENIRQGE